MSEVVLAKEGLRTRSCDLWLDAKRRTSCSFLSHAHGDHFGRHDQAIGSAATLALVAKKLRNATTVALPAPWRRFFTFGPLKLELIPAGHILGSSQLVIDVRGHRTAYTGHINTAISLTAEPLGLARCDTLVIESTFGDPRFKLPPTQVVHEQMAAFAESSLEAGATPVFFARSLGKAQEAAKILGSRGFSVRLHPDAWTFVDIYAAHGVELPNASALGDEREEGEVIVAPLKAKGTKLLEKRGELRTCLLSGEALDPGLARRAGVDRALPLSDHADFDGLISYVEATGAEKVLVHDGFADTLARELRERGIHAKSLEPSPQLELF